MQTGIRSDWQLYRVQRHKCDLERQHSSSHAQNQMFEMTVTYRSHSNVSSYHCVAHRLWRVRCPERGCMSCSASLWQSFQWFPQSCWQPTNHLVRKPQVESCDMKAQNPLRGQFLEQQKYSFVSKLYDKQLEWHYSRISSMKRLQAVVSVVASSYNIAKSIKNNLSHPYCLIHLQYVLQEHSLS